MICYTDASWIPLSWGHLVLVGGFIGVILLAILYDKIIPESNSLGDR